jgi:phosphoenolpyruvate carboxykinase (GTP)
VTRHTQDIADRRIMAATTDNQKLKDWVDHWVGVLQPDDVEWCDGSDEEWDRLTQLLVDGGTFERLAEDKRPNSFLALSDPGDVARVEDRTFICSEREIDAGPTNNWRAPAEMRDELTGLFTGAMKGRTLYVCRSRWARWARPSPTSACSSPTRPTWP